MVSCFNGATLDFAAMNLTAKFPSSSFHLTYEHAPNASLDASANVHRMGCSIALAGVRQLSNSNWLNNKASLNRLVPILAYRDGVHHPNQALFSKDLANQSWRELRILTRNQQDRIFERLDLELNASIVNPSGFWFSPFADAALLCAALICHFWGSIRIQEPSLLNLSH